MKIILELFATLSGHLPAGDRCGRVELDVEDGASVTDLIQRYRVPACRVQQVLVNGKPVPPSERSRRRLREGDELAVLQPAAGG